MKPYSYKDSGGVHRRGAVMYKIVETTREDK